MATPKMIANNLDILNLCPSLLSNKITVEIWKKIPITMALMIYMYCSAKLVLLDINVPRGVMAAKNIKKPAICILL